MSVSIQTVDFQRKAVLSALSEGPPWTVNGIALGAGDITVGQSGIKKVWPAEELQQAAKTLEGKNLVVNHNNEAEGVVGKVTKAGYKENVGVIYEAELFEEDLAEKINNGLLEVSIRGYHNDVDEMTETDDGAKVVEGIKFDNLSIVPTGAAPSNTLEMGEHDELSAAELAALVSELQEIEPGMWVTDGDAHGITISPAEDGEVEVDIYEESDDKWRSIGETQMFSTSDLEEWDVDEEEDIGAQQDDSEEDSEENATQDKPKGVPTEYAFVNEDDAMSLVEEEDDLTGVHEMDGWWVPGETHEQFTEWLSDQRVSSDENSELAAEGDKIQWDSSGGLTRGVVVDRQMEGCFEDRLSGEEKVCAEEGDPVLLINVVEKNESDKWKKTDKMVAHMESSVEETDFTMLSKHKMEEDMAPTWTEGDLVQWQVEPQLFGKIVHVDEKRGVVMVEIHERMNGELTTTNFTISAGFSDLSPLDHGDGMSGHMGEEDEEEMADELEDVPWDEEDLEEFKEELGRVEGEEEPITNDADKKKNRERSPERFIDEDLDEDELEGSTHEPTYSGKDDNEWNKPSLNDFTEDSWEDLSDDEKSSIGGHFIFSMTGFPAENFSDMKLPVVRPDGTLSMNAVRNAKARLSQTDGLSSDQRDSVESMLNGLMPDDEEENMDYKRSRTIDDTGNEPGVQNDGPVDISLDLINKYLRIEGNHERDKVDGMLSWMFGATDLPTETMADFRLAAKRFLDETPGTDAFSGLTVEQFRDWLLMHGDRSAGQREMDDETQRGELPPGKATPVHVLTGDDFWRRNKSRESELDNTTKVFNMTDEIEQKLAELNEPVAVEQSDLEELQEKADRFEEMSSTLESLKERTDILDSVDREQVEALADGDEPMVVESARYEELESESEQVKMVYAAALADQMPGFEAEELAGGFSIEELREKYEAQVGDLEDELAAEPRSGDVDEESLEERADEESEEELEPSETDEAEEKRAELRDKILG